MRRALARRIRMDRSHPLRPYQTAAIAAVRASWARGARRACVVLPTGAGKTTVAAALLAGARSPLALVHTTTLRDQAQRRLGPGVRVLTIQAALRLRGAARAALARHDVVFLDECHHLGAAAWQRVLCLLAPDALVVGCTATPWRADGTALGRGGAGFDAMVATAAYSALLRAGWLAPCRVVDASQYRGDPAGAYLALGARRPGIVFTPTTKAAHACVAHLLAGGVRAAAITATTPDAHRQWAFAAYDRGELDVLVSPMALAEGFDSPRAAVCVLDRSCATVGVYLQTAGRVLRPHHTKGPGATAAVLLDLRGASARHGNPTDDRTYSLDGTSLDEATQRPRRTTAPAPAMRREPAPVSGVVPRRTTAPAPAMRREPAPVSGVVPRRTAPTTETVHRAGVAAGRALRTVWQWLRWAA